MTERPYFRLGLTGYPLGHSLSPRLHTAALAAARLPGEYQLYPADPAEPRRLAELAACLRAGELNGLNVTTMPTPANAASRPAPAAESCAGSLLSKNTALSPPDNICPAWTPPAPGTAPAHCAPTVLAASVR